MIFGLLQQSAAGERGPSEARGPWHSAIVPPTKDGPDWKCSIQFHSFCTQTMYV